MDYVVVNFPIYTELTDEDLKQYIEDQLDVPAEDVVIKVRRSDAS